jgi:aspartyl-tRNA(Asn)/glutamyl-tRNA(Gln) amidotransferase subunit C
MPIDLKTVERTAELARLDVRGGLDPAEASATLGRLAEEMAGIISYMDILKEADTDGVEPLYSPLEEVSGPRPDEPGRGAEPEELLSQAPERVGRFFAVPKII